ncbi:MAG TPA: DUF1361 domain-containing protein [Verrucomicrobiae bacterium]|nr:DUF1361 domain-containing protein [Verrucomicrobiae bacterium]
MNDSQTNQGWSRVFPVIALLFASGIGVVLSIFRMATTHNFHYAMLPGNLFLAWLPLVFAMGVHHLHRSGERHSLRLAALALLWLLFFPNAPYIFTDLVHMGTYFRMAFWLDLSLVLLVAMTGFLVGFVSLYLMHSVVIERFGKLTGWTFILVVAWLTGFGVYLGRFLRLNSWDALVHPLGVTHSIHRLATHPMDHPDTLTFPLLFATFLFLGYLMLYALTDLQTAMRVQNLEFKV